MNRLTSSVTQPNSPESQRFFVTATVKKPPLRRPLATFNLEASKRISYCAQLQIFFLCDRRYLSRRRSLNHFRLTMESPQPESDPPASEDFVHIENPNDQSLANSIFSVEEAGIDEVPSSSTETEEDAESSEVRRKVLPPELCRSVMVLTCETTAIGGVCDVFVVGTAHVSEESCREVEAVISYLKPEVVFLELCSSRVAVLTPQNLKS